MKLATCENCGHTIGLLERHGVWNNHSVCAQCEQALTDLSNPKGGDDGGPPRSRKVCCPRCGSERLEMGQRGFDLKSAVIGGLLVGDIGLLAGASGSSKTVITCLACRYRFEPDGTPVMVHTIGDEVRGTRWGLLALIGIICVIGALALGYLVIYLQGPGARQ